MNRGLLPTLLAGLTLLAVSVWLIKSGKKALFTILPMIFMLVMTLWSLVLLSIPFVHSISHGEALKPDTVISGVFGIVLFGLAIWLVAEAVTALLPRKRELASGELPAG